MLRIAVLAAALAISLLGIFAVPAQAHIAMTYPQPRGTDLKQAPCGLTGSTRGDNVSEYAPGETITVEWDETVGHPGHYRIAFDADGNDDFVNPSTPEDDFAFVLVDQIADRDGEGHYTQEVTLPNIECTNCTLQLMQIMTVQVPYNSFYYQCADLTLRSGAPSPDAGAGGDDDDDDAPPDDGGGCAAGGAGGGVGFALIMLAGLGALTARRRRLRA